MSPSGTVTTDIIEATINAIVTVLTEKGPQKIGVLVRQVMERMGRPRLSDRDTPIRALIDQLIREGMLVRTRMSARKGAPVLISLTIGHLPKRVNGPNPYRDGTDEHRASALRTLARDIETYQGETTAELSERMTLLFATILDLVILTLGVNTNISPRQLLQLRGMHAQFDSLSREAPDIREATPETSYRADEDEPDAKRRPKVALAVRQKKVPRNPKPPGWSHQTTQKQKRTREKVKVVGT